MNNTNKKKKGYSGIKHTKSKNGTVTKTANPPMKQDMAYPNGKGKTC